MDHISSMEAIAEVIHLAVAPLFLITGIAGIIGVLSTRLGRIIERGAFYRSENCSDTQ